MRLICPNCDAEYQVDDAAIPASGRDVQCSNCGHAWFQLHADAELAQEAEDALFGDPPIAETPKAEQAGMDQAAVRHPEVRQTETRQDDALSAPANADMHADSALDADAPPRAMGSRQTLAESVLSVLREEAARETAVRREEGTVDTTGSVEMQPDLGLEDIAQSGPTSAAARHIARLKGAAEPDLALEPENQPEPEPKVAARRDLLPDIEEINSTLRANADRAKEDEDAIDALPNLRPRRSGFRTGFVLTIIAAVILSMAYIMAPRIIAQIPGSAPTLRAYVSTVDAGRLWLDGLMQSASGSVRSLTGETN